MENTKKLLEQVQNLNEEERYKDVVNILKNDLLKDSKDADLYIEKAKPLGNLKEYEQCKINSEKALLLNPKSAKAYYYLGKVCSAFKEYRKAIDFYSKAIEIDSEDALFYQGLGFTFFILKNYKKAIIYYKKAVELDSDNPRPLEGLGECYRYQKEYDKAIDYYSKAIELDPTKKNPYNAIGNVYFDQSKFEEAINYYTKFIKIDSEWSGVYRNRAMCYDYQEMYFEALKDYRRYLDLQEDKDSYKYKHALNRVQDIEIILQNTDYEDINEIVKKIKDLLSYKDGCVTHFTSLSTARYLILKNSSFRLSEGTFLNDTSEGTSLFKYLSFNNNLIKNKDTIDELFTQKPFIGSFVSENQHNDLAMWRMYGKEQQEEAKGCALTINIEKYKNAINDIINNDETFDVGQEFIFYRVCYIDDKGKFTIPDIKNKTKKEKELNDLMKSLHLNIDEYNKKGNFEYGNKLEELLNEIKFLVKSSEYLYEKEIRLVVNGAGFYKKIDSDFIPKVYIDLAPLKESLTKITIGPKVDRSDEWASVFHYSLINENFESEIHISHLPYK